MSADELHTAAESRIGRVVGDGWKLRALLGVGGTAAVYEAQREGVGRAIKILHAHLSLNARAQRRLRRELLAVAAVDHPAAVRIDEVGDDASVGLFLIMELLRGESLDRLRKRCGGALGARAVIDLAGRMLEVLAAMHARGVVHRDLKPDNLFFTDDRRLKVLDFGIAGGRALATHSSSTANSSILGTPAFMSPEQARADFSHVSSLSDIWSAGATIFTLLTGRHVHEGRTTNEQLGMAMTLPSRSLASCARRLPRSLIDVVDRALMYEPQERWQSATEMLAALRDVEHELDRKGDTGAGSAHSIPDALTLTHQDEVVLGLAAASPSTVEPTETPARPEKRSRGRTLLPPALVFASLGAFAASYVGGPVMPATGAPAPAQSVAAPFPVASEAPTLPVLATTTPALDPASASVDARPERPSQNRKHPARLPGKYVTRQPPEPAAFAPPPAPPIVESTPMNPLNLRR